MTAEKKLVPGNIDERSWDDYVDHLAESDEYPCMVCGYIVPLASVRTDPLERDTVCVDCLLERLRKAREAAMVLYHGPDRGKDSAGSRVHPIFQPILDSLAHPFGRGK